MTVTATRTSQVSLHVESFTVSNRVAVGVNNIILAATAANMHQNVDIHDGWFKTTYKNLRFTGTTAQVQLVKAEFAKLGLHF